MEKIIADLGITVNIETADIDCLGAVDFYPAGKDCTYNRVQTGRGGIKVIMATIRAMMLESGLKQFYFDADGCEKRARIYQLFLRRAGLQVVHDAEDDLFYFTVDNSAVKFL